MKDLRTQLAIGLWLLTTAACGVGQATNPGQLPAGPASTEMEMQGPAPVTTVEVNGQTILANLSGLTLYVFDIDVANESRCYDGCAIIWPPTIVKPGERVSAPFGVTTRRDGSSQLTLAGRPLYTYVDDAKPGDINGDNLQNVWHIVPFKN